MGENEGLSVTFGRSAEACPAGGDHVVQFYRDETLILEAVARFVLAGLRRGDAVMVVVTAVHQAALERRLASAGVALPELVMRGRLRFYDAHQTLPQLMIADTIDRRRFHEVVRPLLEEARRASTSGGVSAYGEMVDLLWRTGDHAGVLRLEELWHELVATERISILCGYAMGAFDRDGDGLDEVRRRHTETRLPERQSARPAETEGTVIEAHDVVPLSLGAHLQGMTERLIQAVTPQDIAGIGLEVVNQALGVEAGTVSLVRSPDGTAGRAEWDADGEIEARVIAELRRGDTSSVLSIPLAVGGVVLGSMNFGFATPRRLSSAERAFMQAVVDQCALALERARLYDAERRARAQLEARQADMDVLYRLMEAVTRAEGLEDVLGPALDAVTAGLKLGRAAVLLYDGEGVMRFQAWRSLSETYRRTVEGHSPWGRDEQEPAPVLVSDVETDDAWRSYLPLFRQERIRALAFIPLTHQRRLLGKLMVYSERPRAFTRHELELVQTVAAQVSLALSRANLLRSERAARRDAERAAERTRRLQRVTAGLSGAATIAEVARVVVAEGCAATSAATGALWLVASGGASAELVHQSGYSDSGSRLFASVPLEGRGGMPLLDVLRTGAPCWIDSKADLAQRYPQLAVKVGDVPDYALACLPLKTSGRANGVLAFTFGGAGDLDESRREFLQTIAHQGELALERAQLYEREQQARVEAEGAQRRASFKAQASAILASSLEFEATLRNVTSLAVSGFAEWCAIELGDDRGGSRLVAAARVGGLDVDVDAGVAAARPAADGEPGVAAEVLRTGLPKLDEHAIHAPMTIRGATIGVITFARTQSARCYDAADLEAAVSVAQRAAFAVESARLHRELQRAARARDDLIAMVSHDLRNLIGIVAMNTTAMARSAAAHENAGASARSPDWYMKNVEIIARSAQRMDRLIRDLLDLGSIEAGQLKVDRRPEDVRALLSQTVEDLQPLAVSKGVRLHAVTPGEPQLASCDRQRVFQVLSNLVGNAIKFTPPGGSIVVASESRGDGVQLAVRDTGPGIDPQHLPRIFDRYYQASARESGVGLGLFIARGIVQAHGGRIWVESPPGQGTSFFFTLDASPASLAGAGAA